MTTAAPLSTTHSHEHIGGNVYLLDPRDILIPDLKFRARKFLPKPAAIKAMADSLRGGQEQPIQCRMEDGKVVCIFGFTRIEAAKLIHEQDGKGTFKLRAEIMDKGPKDALISAIRENDTATRNKTSDVDKAFSHQSLRDEPFSMSDAEIASSTGCSQAWVSKLKKLLKLEPDVLKQLHEGAITTSDAITMADLEVERQREVARKAETAKKVADEKAAAKAAKTGKPVAEQTRKTATGPVVKDAIREQKTQQAAKPKAAAEKPAKPGKAPAEPKAPSASPPRGMKDIREFFGGLDGGYEEEPIREFAKKVLQFCNGKITDKQMENAVLKFGGFDGTKAATDSVDDAFA